MNSTVNPSQFSPAALQISSKLPKTSDPCGKVLFGNINHDLQIPFRADYQLSDKQTFFARYLLNRIEVATPYDLSGGNALTSVPKGADITAQSLTFGNTYLVSPSIVNSFRVYGNRVSNFEPGAKYFGPTDVGIKAFSYVPQYLLMPVTGGFTLGSTGGGPSPFGHSSNFGINDDLSIVRGAHQFAFGGNIMRSILWTTSNAFSTAAYTINGAVTGSGLADFLLGQVSQIRQANPNPINIYFNLDRFYANQKSTVIPGAPPGFIYPGDPGFHGKAGMANNYRNIDPRLGLAWDPSGDGKTAIRIGAGIAHDFIRQDIVVSMVDVSKISGVRWVEDCRDVTGVAVGGSHVNLRAGDFPPDIEIFSGRIAATKTRAHAQDPGLNLSRLEAA